MSKKNVMFLLIVSMMLLCTLGMHAQGVEMLKNTTFTTGLFPWNTYVATGASATISVVNGEAKAAITNGGTNGWDVSLLYNSLNIVTGEKYTVTFDARADQPRTIDAFVGQSVDPYAVYSGNDPINLTTSMQTYTFTFTMAAASDPTAVLELDFGGNNTDVYVDNISLINHTVTPTPVVTPPPTYVNIAKNKVVGVSSSFSNSFPKENLVDDNRTTVWGSSTGSGQQWMFVDLGAVTEIDGLGIYWFDKYYATQFEIYVSNTAKTWNKAATIAKKDNSPTVLYATASTRYIGILFTQMNSVAVGVQEFEVLKLKHFETPTPTMTVEPTETPYSWDFQCHTNTHPHLDQLTESQIRDQYEKVDAAFASHGLPAPEHVAYPYGGQNELVRRITAEYRVTGRLAWGEKMEMTYPIPDPYQLKTVEVQGNTTWAEVKEWIDNCIMVDAFMQIFTHKVVDSATPPQYSMSKALLIQTLDYLVQKQNAGEVKVLPLREAYDEWNGTQAVINFAFDDGFTSDYTMAYPLFKERNLVGTSYIVTNAVGDGQYMTWSQIDIMSKGQ